MYDGIDLENWLLSVVDVHESERHEKQSETIYYDQAERFAEAAINISKQLVAGEPIDDDLRNLEDEVKRPDFSEALKDPALLKILEEIITKTPTNMRLEKLKKFGEDYIRADPRDKESPSLRLVWERCCIDLAREIIEEISPGADRIFELFRMVLKTHPSPETQQFLGRLARCYIWGFDPECVILCRSVLDTAFRKNISDDICEKHCNEKHIDFKKKHLVDFTLSNRIYAAFKEGLIDKTARTLAQKIKRYGDKAVHYQPDITKDVLGTMRNTLDVIEQLQKKRS